MSDKRKAVVSAVGNDLEQEVTDSDVESANRVTEEQVCASKIEQGKEELAKVEMVMIDHGRQAPAKQVKLLVDSGDRKTLINEEIWKKNADEGREAELEAEEVPDQVQTIRNHRVPAHHGEEQVQDEGRNRSHHPLHGVCYVMRGKEQPLLGLMDAQRLGIIQMNVKGAEQKEDRVARLEMLVKQPAVKTGIVSGGQTQRDIDRKMESITDEFPDLFTGLGRAKVEPVLIEVDQRVKPVQQKSWKIALLYVDRRLREHLAELKREGVISGPLGPEWAKGCIERS